MLNKRGLGYVNYLRKRRHRHDMAVLRRLEADLAALRPDHIAVTGDLVNLGLPGEWGPARAFLERLGRPDEVSHVPGNHDAYILPVQDGPSACWADFMRGDGAVDAAFPYLRRRGRVALVGVNSAVPTWLFSAAGRVGAGQARRLAAMLRALGGEGLFRVVLIHHPPAERGASMLRRLEDAALVRDAIAAGGAELVLHGHDHRPSIASIAGADGPIPVVAVPSASVGLDGGHEHPAAYNLYEIAGTPGAWRCEGRVRQFTGSGFVETRRLVLHGLSMPGEEAGAGAD